MSVMAENKREEKVFSLIRLLTIAIAAVLLGGCFTVSKVAYQPSSVAPIKEILLVVPDPFPAVRVGIGGNMGLMFGGVGAGIAGATAAGQAETIDQAISGQGVGYQQQLVEQLTASLAAAGIHVQTVAAARAAKRGAFVEDYQPLLARAKADAVLDISVLEASYGGTHPLLDPDLRPILRVRARLVSARTLDTLYADDISYGYTNTFVNAKEIKAPKEYYYPNLQAVIADKAKAAEGLRLAATEVARFLARQFITPGSSGKTEGVAAK